MCAGRGGRKQRRNEKDIKTGTRPPQGAQERQLQAWFSDCKKTDQEASGLSRKAKVGLRGQGKAERVSEECGGGGAKKREDSSNLQIDSENGYE